MPRDLQLAADPIAETDSGSACRMFRLRRTVTHALMGFAFGFILLHPVTMFVFDWMGVHPPGKPLLLCLDWLSRSFTPEMIPMGLVFGLLSMSIGGLDGFYRSLVQFQRDDLARQLDLNQRQRGELERQFSALRELERSKQRTARFLVHDLKNHVGCVLGYVTRLLTRAERSGWQRTDVRALETVHRQAKRMAGALRDMLELARLSDQPRLKLEAIPVKDLLYRSVADAALCPEEGPVCINDDIQADLTVRCDRLLFERTLANLVLNAFKHNGPDVRVSIGLSRSAGEVRFFCHDTGNGIPVTVRDRLFEEFASDGRRDTLVPSYGLGLAFCKAAVTAHGGKIWFESVEGEGSTFFFSLPTLKEQGETI